MKFITRITKEIFLEKKKRKTRVKEAPRRDFFSGMCVVRHPFRRKSAWWQTRPEEKIDLDKRNSKEVASTVS
jgi:hypothetical protein